MEDQIISITYAARLLTFKCLGNSSKGWAKFEWINKPGLPLSAKYIVQEPTLNLHSTTVAWLSQLMEKHECLDGWSVFTLYRLYVLCLTLLQGGTFL